ncbi:dihydrodipicolinate synthase family protein [Marinimicrococcus flavescens]|uniref:Dihydrodipicolinate synthase family protein n=1 Tax=Marinimicrococcus flavescens TaxID=3031815 RepID=A0AAP3XRL0_9PROT|nr:dihydrodipicolinate synthase family protein [Marinimicrococcus flavescens]
MTVAWTGVFPALTTCFTAEAEIDEAAMERFCAWQIEAGIDGLIVAGSLGEGSTLSAEEKLSLVRIARAASRGRPVLMTLAESATRRAIELARRAEAAGADGLMVLPPMMYHASDDEACCWFEEIAGATGLPVMVYSNPVAYRIDVRVEMLARLAERCANIVAVKESSDDVRRVIAIRNALGERLAIFAGVDNLALESCVMGADGWVAGLVDAFPHETLAVWRLARAGRIEKALAIYRWFAPLLELDVSPRLVQNIKLAQAMLGVGSEHVRPPRRPLEGAERARVTAVIEKALAARPQLAA